MSKPLTKDLREGVYEFCNVEPKIFTYTEDDVRSAVEGLRQEIDEQGSWAHKCIDKWFPVFAKEDSHSSRGGAVSGTESRPASLNSHSSSANRSNDADAPCKATDSFQLGPEGQEKSGTSRSITITDVIALIDDAIEGLIIPNEIGTPLHWQRINTLNMIKDRFISHSQLKMDGRSIPDAISGTERDAAQDNEMRGEVSGSVGAATESVANSQWLNKDKADSSTNETLPGVSKSIVEPASPALSLRDNSGISPPVGVTRSSQRESPVIATAETPCTGCRAHYIDGKCPEIPCGCKCHKEVQK